MSATTAKLALTGGAECAAFEEFLTVAKGASRHTVAAYGADVRGFLGYVTPKVGTVGAITQAHVEGWLATQARAAMAARTTARRLTAVRRFFAFCISRGWLKDDPTARVPLPKVPQSLPKALTEGDMQALLAAPLGESAVEVRLRLILSLLYASGLRVSELCGLTLADVEDSEGVVLRVTGKGDKTRLVPLGPVAAVALETYLTTARVQLKGAKSQFLLAGPTGRALTRQRVFQLVKEAGARVGVKVAPHHLRHTFATHMVQHDADLRAVQVMLGHASLNTTQIYTKVAIPHLKETLNRHHPLNSPRKKPS